MKLYLVETKIWHGTIMISNDTVVASTKELAEKIKKALDEINSAFEGQQFAITTRINDANYYQSEDEVPILSNLKKE